LAQIPGVEVVELKDGEACCGSAGIYNLVEPVAGAALGAKKADAILAEKTALVVSGNPGCNLQIAAALRNKNVVLPIAHTIEVIAASIADRRSATLLAERASTSPRSTPLARRILGEGARHS